MFLKVITIALLSVLVFSEQISYKNYKLYKVTPTNDEEVKFLTNLKDQNEYVFWMIDYIRKNVDIKIMVEPEKQQAFESKLAEGGINGTLVADDVQKLIDQQNQRPSSRNARNTEEYNWDYYQTWDEINQWMDYMVAKYPDQASIVTAGISVEGRSIRGVKISSKKRDTPVIGMIESGLHAREWITPATATWMIKELLASNDPDIRNLVDNVEWHIFPVTNPDGYVYSFTSDRMWRKNRSTASSTNCSHINLDDEYSNGVDLNRNFGFLWRTVGASTDPCQQTFAGPTAFSEPESRGIANYVKRLQATGNMIYYFSLHSYSQLLLVPYSHVGGADVLSVPNYGDMFEIAARGAEKLQERHNTTYKVGTSLDILYPVTGSGFDWAKGGAQVPIVLLYELRDLGDYGFLLPAKYIIPNGEEFMDSVVEVDKVTRKLGYYYNAGSLLKMNIVLIVTTLYLLL